MTATVQGGPRADGDLSGSPRRSRKPWRSVPAVLVRMHLAPLRLHKLVTVLVIAGISIGTALTVGTISLFDSTHKPFVGVGGATLAGIDFEVQPRTQDRLDEGFLRAVREVPGVRVAVPVVAALSEVRSAQGVSHYAAIIGTDCSAEQIVGEVGCESMRTGGDAAPGPGAPLVVTRRLADALGVAAGDPLALPGSLADEAHVARVVDGGEEIDHGYAVLESVPDAQAALSRGPNLSAIYVDGDDAAAASLRDAVGTAAVVGPPEPLLPPAVRSLRYVILFYGVLCLAIGVLTAVIAYSLSLDSRRRHLGLTMTLGQSPGRLLFMISLEGALLGTIGGVMAIPLALGFSHVVVAVFNDTLFADTGTALTTMFNLRHALVAVGFGTAAGALAGVLAGIRLAREGAGLAVREQHTIATTHRMRRWPAFALLLVPVGLLMAWFFGRGHGGLEVFLPATALLSAGLLVGLFSLVAPMMRGLGALLPRNSAAALMARAEADQDQLRLSAVVTVIAVAAALLIINLSSGFKAEALVEEQWGSMVGTNELYSAQPAGRLTVAGVSDAALAVLRQASPQVAVHREVLLSMPQGETMVVGVEPGEADRLVRIYRGDGARSVLEGGGVIVNPRLATRAGIDVGDDLTVPTPRGQTTLRVRAIGDTTWPNGTGVGVVAVTSTDLAAETWSAPVSEVLSPHAVDLPSSAVHRLDPAAAPVQIRRSVRTFYVGFTILGLATLTAAVLAVAMFQVLGLTHRRRLRAVLRFQGLTPAIERRQLAYQALGLTFLAMVTLALAGLAFVSLFTLSAGTLIGFELPWSIPWKAFGIALAATVAACAIATVPALVAAGDLDVVRAIGEE